MNTKNVTAAPAGGGLAEFDPDPDIRIEWLGGNCPVQAEGTIDGRPFYFRARGTHWSFGVGADPIGAPDWYIRRRYSWRKYFAGWMPQYTALACIAKAVRLYARETSRAALAKVASNGDTK